MNTVIRCLGLSSAILAVATAWPAELPPPEAGSAVPNPVVMLARSPVVQQELRLDRRQIQAVEEAVAEVDLPLWTLRDLPADQRAPQVSKLLATFENRLHKILKPEQQQRFAQVRWRALGWGSLLRPEARQLLNLTDGQSEKLHAVLDPAAKRTGEGGSIVLKDGEQKAVHALLTPDQQRGIVRMTGPAFDFSRVRLAAVHAPELRGVTAWVNSRELQLSDLKGKVVALNFWTFGCINCVHNLPHYKDWHRRFASRGVVVLGVHTPETKGERELDQVKNAVKERQIEYPVAVDNGLENWRAWAITMWPSTFLIDKRGDVRYWWRGELNWEGAKGEEFLRGKIEELLAE